MKVVGFAGWSGAGKTTLVERVIAALGHAGQRVSVIKHAHHRFDIDHPGKDTYRHRAAGAFEVLVASRQRLALMREIDPPADPDMHALLARLDAGVDWVLVEGFKHGDLPKIEVWRAAAGRPLLYPHDPLVAAIATDSPDGLIEPGARAILDLNDAPSVADWLLAQAPLFDYDRTRATRGMK